jgi:hypothetical protein
VDLSRSPGVWANAIAGILSAAVSVGLITAGTADNVNGAVTALVGAAGLLLPFAAALISRRHTTPLADPRDTRGVRLAPIDGEPISR